MSGPTLQEETYQRFIDANRRLYEATADFLLMFGEDATRKAIADMRDGIKPEMPELTDFAGLPKFCFEREESE